MSAESKVLVWSWCDPTFPSGSPAIVSELVSHFAPGQVELACEYQGPSGPARQLKLAHPVDRLAAHRLWPFKRGARVRQAVRFAEVPVLVTLGLRKIREFRPDFLLAVFYDERWILSSYLMSKITGVPVIYYIHDPYLESAVHRGGASAKLAQWLEPVSLRHGRVLVLSESQRGFYRDKYGIDSTIVRQLAGRTRRRATASDRQDGSRTIGFAGTIYENNRGLVRKLVDAAAGCPGVRVILWTNAKPEFLSAHGIEGAHVEIRFEADQDRLTSSLGRCDLLYLPLEFKDSSRLPTDSLRYAFPTKVRDYLLAGPPILVHCPEDYGVARFLLEHEAAYHLGSDDPAVVAEWVSRWSLGRVHELEEEAMARAAADFAPEVNLARLHEAMAPA